IPGGRNLTSLDEPQQSELAHALVEAVARPSARAFTIDKGTVDEVRQRIQDDEWRSGSGLTNMFCRFEAERTDERADASQHGSFVLRQEIVTPCDGGFERLMARRRGPASANEQVEPVVETLDQLI